jgi:hypothetical protein
METEENALELENLVGIRDLLVGELSSWVTAFATVALAFLTLALVVATVRMVRAMARPQVVANLESNQWSIRHMDLVIENCGNAPAYDVSIKIDPPIELADVKGDVQLPFSNISIIRPNQSLVSFASDWAKLKDKIFQLEISWKVHPKSSKTETLSYQLNMRSLDGISHLGKLNPMIQVAEELKKIRDDWRPVAQGQRRTKVDMFGKDDRDEEQRLREERMAELREHMDAEAAEIISPK